MLGLEDVDTDEYDQHVIVHEFQHFLEDAISRSDSPGGAHSLQREARHAPGLQRGFANAFSAMVLDDPHVSRLVRFAAGQTSPSTSKSTPPSPAGWFNEGSVQSLVWDLYDARSDGARRRRRSASRPISTCSGERASHRAGVDQHLSVRGSLEGRRRRARRRHRRARRIAQVSGTDAFGSTETNSADVDGSRLPLYTDLTLGGAVQRVCGTLEAGTYNKLGNRLIPEVLARERRSVRSAPNTRRSAPSRPAPTPDPDFVLFGDGSSTAGCPRPTVEDADASALEAGDYVIEVYEYSHVDPRRRTPESRRHLHERDVS